MPQFGDKSKSRLVTCDDQIQRVFMEVIKHEDCAILEGARSDERQAELFREGRSTLDGVTQRSKHQVETGGLSLAVDAIPYPTTLHGVSIWQDEFRFTRFAGVVIGIGLSMGIRLRWGGDWDSDGSKANQTFHDLPHFELVQ